MAKVTGPMMSVEATGKFANTMVFVRSKAGPVVRQLVTPTNPKSPAQTGTRSMMRWASQEWQQLTSPEQTTWLAAVTKPGESAFNAFVRAAMNEWKNGLFAQSEFPTVTEAAPAIPTTPTATVNGKQVTIAWVDPAARLFGVSIYFDAATITTMGPSIAVAVIDAGVQKAIISNLEAGTYHYRIRGASHEGIFGPGTADATFVIS
jgi:hypothetical protein